MDLKELENSKKTIDWLLQNGDFKDTETAYNIAINSINTIDEAINFIHSSLHVKDKNIMTFCEWRKHNKIDRLDYNKFLDIDGSIMTFKQVNKRYLECIKL